MSSSKVRKLSLECYACQIGGVILIDSKLSKEWLMLEKDQQLSEEREVCKGESESLEESCGRSALSPDRRACKTSLGSFASRFSFKVVAGNDFEFRPAADRMQPVFLIWMLSWMNQNWRSERCIYEVKIESSDHRAVVQLNRWIPMKPQPGLNIDHRVLYTRVPI